MSQRKRWQPKTVLTVFGTRPEAVKLAPILDQLDARRGQFLSIKVLTSQHVELLQPFLEFFRIVPEYDLSVMRQTPSINGVVSRVIDGLDPVLHQVAPDLVLVQGDTGTALAAAMASFNRGIPVGHVEAGLRSGNRMSPFPEEMNRRLVSQLATYHFAPTEWNRKALLAEGIPESGIFVTGNPIVDALHQVLGKSQPSPMLLDVLQRVSGRRFIVVTTHRRENFGPVMFGNLTVLRDFIKRNPGIGLVFPVHPNPMVRQAAASVMEGVPGIILCDPLSYPDFLWLISKAWLVASDSGGIQEEAPSLGKPLLILRENTERPEAVACGVARLVGNDPAALSAALDEALEDDRWTRLTSRTQNPFGSGNSGQLIVDHISRILYGEGGATGEAALQRAS
jgi:UDP-N-acetylglucosamine 2-epimerase (non-hydrolysing)